MQAERPEPWLRGPIPGVDARVAPVLYAFQHAREDLAAHTQGLTTEQVWARPHGVTPLGFHLRHIAGSTGRLITYLQGRQLTDEQLRAVAAEKEAGASRDELLGEIDRVFREAEAIVRGLDPGALAQPRAVGRKQLPTTVAGLLTHTAEHTLRHVGEAIVTAKLLRQ